MAALIRNIVFAFPAATYEEYKSAARGYATFYAELLGMRIIREDWLKVAKDESSSPQLAFGDGPGEYRPVRWPDPEHPQQLHLDIVASDLDAADELVVRLGATRLKDEIDHRTYADAVGHPFCVYRDGERADAPARIARVVVDCPDPPVLAAFYSGLLDMPERVEDSSDRIVIAKTDRSLPMLAFQRAPDHVAPRWPDPAYPQQVHLDIWVDDGEGAQSLAVELGATKLPAMGGSCPVYADPAGHPFCLCTPGQ